MAGRCSNTEVRSMNAITQFPDWTPEGFVAPEGWTDDSWRNDVMPKWVSPCGYYYLWVDFPNEKDREIQGNRFLLVEGEEPFSLDCVETVISTDSFEEVKNLIATLP